ncbi:MAG: twin-arginine translocase TatA/TatE family subunit [Methanomicrobia archaeon]|nr:twin-arginine translocase TatA/TatE family subunit [Methanomicrobia archaeon]
MPGGGELLVIGILVIVLLFGAAKVPQLARSFGQAMGEFKKAKRESELNLKQFEDSVVGEETEQVKIAAKQGTKSGEVNIREVAKYMGISTEGKSDEQLKAEVQAKMNASAQ